MPVAKPGIATVENQTSNHTIEPTFVGMCGRFDPRGLTYLKMGQWDSAIDDYNSSGCGEFARSF
jgi:hypothetical protein